MKSSKLIILCLFFYIINFKVEGSELLLNLFPKSVEINQSIAEELLEGEVYSDSAVSSKDEKQKLFTFVAGIHPKKCVLAFPRMAMLENYQNYLSSFVESSIYDHKEKSFTMILSHMVLPYKMRVKVFVEYPKIMKDYPFEMKGGLFPGLKGIIHTRRFNKKCLFFLTAHWKGKKVFNDSLLELMSETLSKLGLSLIFRKTKS